MKTSAELPKLLCVSQAKWEAWLEDHHAKSRGVLLKIAKKDSGRRSVSYAEAVESALCYGWIDGQKGALDDKFFVQRFTPRRPKSVWSKINTEKVTKLISEGKMRPAGLKEAEAAKKDGRWDAAYASPANSTVPEDFQAELDKHPKAKAFFETLTKANRYSILWRIQNAKRPETRRAKIEQFVTMLGEGKKLGG